MDAIIGSAIISLIQVVAELAKQHGMTADQVNEHFLESWQKVQDRPANELPDSD